MSKLANKTAVITGGTHGMGLAVAKALVDGGARVVLTGSNQGRVESAQRELGARAKVVRSDTTSLPEIHALGDTVRETLAQVDLVFVNAGYAVLGPLATMSVEAFERTFAINTRGAFFTAQRLAPLVRPGGSFVFTTSIANETGYPGMSAYAGAKAAVRAFVRNFAAELTAHDIRVNAVSPGFIRTPTMGVADASDVEIDAFAKEGEHITPMKRIGSVDEVARAVLFLAFDATFTTGAELPVDGGLGQI